MPQRSVKKPNTYYVQLNREDPNAILLIAANYHHVQLRTRSSLSPEKQAQIIPDMYAQDYVSEQDYINLLKLKRRFDLNQKPSTKKSSTRNNETPLILPSIEASKWLRIAARANMASQQEDNIYNPSEPATRSNIYYNYYNVNNPNYDNTIVYEDDFIPTLPNYEPTTPSILERLATLPSAGAQFLRELFTSSAVIPINSQQQTCIQDIIIRNIVTLFPPQEVDLDYAYIINNIKTIVQEAGISNANEANKISNIIITAFTFLEKNEQLFTSNPNQIATVRTEVGKILIKHCENAVQTTSSSYAQKELKQDLQKFSKHFKQAVASSTKNEIHIPEKLATFVKNLLHINTSAAPVAPSPSSVVNLEELSANNERPPSVISQANSIVNVSKTSLTTSKVINR